MSKAKNQARNNARNNSKASSSNSAIVTKVVININQFLFLYELEDDVDNLPRFFYCLNANIFQL